VIIEHFSAIFKLQLIALCKLILLFEKYSPKNTLHLFILMHPFLSIPTKSAMRFIELKFPSLKILYIIGLFILIKINIILFMISILYISLIANLILIPKDGIFIEHPPLCLK